MPIKVQKIIRFIPIVNFYIFFVWIRFYFKHGCSQFRFLKNNSKMILAMIVICIPFMIVSFMGYRNAFQIILSYISFYFTILVSDTIAIRDQEKFFAEQDEKKII